MGQLKDKFSAAKTFVLGHKTAGLIVLALAAVVGGGLVLFPNTYEVEQTTIWVDDEEPCVDYISQAKQSLGMSSGVGVGEGGVGDNQIPEPYGDTYTITGYTEYGIQYFNAGRQPTSQARWDSTSPQAVVHDKWVQAGAKYDDGVAVLDNKYLVATTPKFGNVGDHVTFYLSNGKSLECILADVKGADADSEWGHDGGHSVLEFEVEPAKYTQYGNPGNGYMDAVKGARTTSWTNHGQVVDVASGLSGSAGGASSAASQTASGTAASAREDCQGKSKYDNSTLVAAWISYSYSRKEEESDSNPSTALYQEVCEAVFGTDDVTASYHYHSCDRGTSAAVRWTGADVDFPAWSCNHDTVEYCRSKANMWKIVAENVTIDGDRDEWAKSHGIEPGDIGITDVANGHINVYIGMDAIEEGYDSIIKGNKDTGPGTGGDRGEPEDNCAFISASAHTRGPCINPEGGTYTFVRYIGDYPDADKYKDVGEQASLKLSSSKGTSCDCCPPEGVHGPSTAAEVMAQVAEHIADDDSHGYSQPNRLGDGTTETIQVNGENIEIHGGDYDCSSMMSMCAIAAGLITEDDVFWTGIEDEVLTKAGFTSMPFDASQAQRGDILLMDGHTGMCIGDGMQAHASGSETGGIDGATGDQTGGEIVRVELSSSWVTMYRPPGGAANTKTTQQNKKNSENCDCGNQWDNFDSSESSGDEEKMMEENAKKIWSVLSVWGLEDEAIAGVLSNFETECGIDPTGIEAIYDSPYAMNGRKEPMRGTDETSLKNLADWTEGGMWQAYQGSGITLAWDFYNNGPDGRHYAGIGIGSWTGYDQVHDVYGKAASVNMDWWSIDFQIAYLIGADSNANPPGEEFWKNYQEKAKGQSASETGYTFYRAYEMPSGGPAGWDAKHAQHGEKWFSKMKSWTRDDSYANSVLSMASKLSETGSLSGLSDSAKNCGNSRSKMSSITSSSGATSSAAGDMVSKAESMVGAAYRDSGYEYGGEPSNSSFTCSGLVDWASGKPSNTNSPESLYESVSASGNMKTNPSEFVRGDLVFYDYDGRHPGHVAIYVGDGKVVHANGQKWGVVVQDVYFNGTPIGGGKYV